MLWLGAREFYVGVAGLLPGGVFFWAYTRWNLIGWPVLEDSFIQVGFLHGFRLGQLRFKFRYLCGPAFLVFLGVTFPLGLGLLFAGSGPFFTYR